MLQVDLNYLAYSSVEDLGGYEKWIDHALETVMFNLVTFKATNDYLCDRFGEDDTGIIIYQSPNNKLSVRIYQCDGQREVLWL